MASRQDKVRHRVAGLTTDFGKYLEVFDRNVPFRKWGQYEFHTRTIRLRHAAGSASAAIDSPAFIRSLWETLQAWGIGSRGSSLAPLSEFSAAIHRLRFRIEALDGEAIDDPALNRTAVGAELWRLIEGLEIVHNDAKLVPCSKALHHLLPELVVPMDRKYTQAFFGWHNPQFQYGQRRVFLDAFQVFSEVARAVHPQRYVGRGWRTSRTKVLDNAVVGFCLVENLITS